MSSDGVSGSTREAAFEVDISRRLGEREIAARFSVESGLTVLFGPSGAGKTSILNMIAGLLRPDRGLVRVNGRILFDSQARLDLAPDRRHIGYVFQDGRLFPHRQVRANLLYGYRLAAPDQRWLSLDAAVEFLGISHLLERWPRSLSGGEAQRVAIGRALLAGARALLMDEPLASVDQGRREEIIKVIERVRDELRVPILYVSHDRSECDRLANRVIEIPIGSEFQSNGLT